MGDWAIGYDFRRLQKDATVSVFTDAVCFGGGSDGSSQRFTGTYLFQKGYSGAVSLFEGQNQESTSARERRRFHVDLVFAF